MLYQIKKIIFFLFAIVSIPLLFSWILYDLDSAFHIGSQIGIKLLPDTLFRDDAIILPIFLSLLFPTWVRSSISFFIAGNAAFGRSF